MKLIALMSIGLIAAATAAAPASAQSHERHDRVVERTRIVHTQRRGDYRAPTRRVCRVTYRHHKRIRTCRTVRR